MDEDDDDFYAPEAVAVDENPQNAAGAARRSNAVGNGDRDSDKDDQMDESLEEGEEEEEGDEESSESVMALYHCAELRIADQY